MASDQENAAAAVSATEQTPLLVTKDVAPAAGEEGRRDGHDDDDDDNDHHKPLPKWQLFWLCFARAIEPMAFFSIFPYINQMAQENGHLADADVGFYSGLIESLFSLTQALVMVFWGKAADSIGRKPVLVFSLVGVSVATSIFGTAKTLAQMILFRCIAGVFAGTIVTIRTMITEISSPRDQAVAFSWFAFSGNLGILLGPILGGALADPAHQYPGLFGHSQFFLDYPYALSSFVIAGLGFIGAITSFFFVTETLDRDDSTTTTTENGDSVVRPKDERPSILSLLRAPGVRIVLYIYCHIMLLAFAYTAIIPVFLFSPVRLGGFGLLPYQISIFMATNGAAQALWLLLAFPRLQRRLGTNGVLRACAIAYPFFFALTPIGNVLLRHGDVAAFWTISPAFQAIGCGVSMAFTAIQLALNDVSPSHRVLGTLNSIALAGTSLTRAFAPALFTSLFALGARTQWLWGYAIWLLLTLLALWYTLIARWLPEKGKDGKAPRRREQEEAGGRQAQGED
ncbi:MFS general substrate transporter [Cryphonectria parasitica EP155]|uniref:MFS general substrate transporter n=1 Tax=Cryphonectria parasitica (strain ATCC 38755 / EP155) TaxID=660469 RepID=A0A9P5CM17_CRYP1|nr:MFS general substrate transporter [Cryphonectria parasitica EP155]KAF3762621.1 MFS general substrate transporter [Cryphonectria parasitica EP155]